MTAAIGLILVICGLAVGDVACGLVSRDTLVVGLAVTAVALIGLGLYLGRDDSAGEPELGE